MRIKPVEQKDLPEVLSLIRQQFPYLSIDLQKLGERVASGKVFVLKAVEGGKMLGFVEAELLGEGVARVNGITVKEQFRKKGVATRLLDEMIELLRKRGIKRIMLLVKQSNEDAKQLYKQKGFRFMGLYQREIDQSVVEEMELDLGEGRDRPSYVS